MCNKISVAAISVLCFLASGGAVRANGELLSIKTVVIDAGHGGHDPGALGGGLREKDVTLDVAVRLGNRIKGAYPDVKVIYTRNRDVYIPLGERSAIANRNKADIFISVHVNSVGGKSGISGTETFIMGTDKSASNMEVCKAENSVILLEDDYSTKYAGYDPDAPDSFIFFNLMQNAQFEHSILLASFIEEEMASGPIGCSRGIKQAPLLVLWKTTMPSALVEIGFISNAADRKKLASKTARDEIAESIFRGFSKYKANFEGKAAAAPVATKPVASEPVAAAPAVEPVAAAPAVAAEPVAAEPVQYWSIQVFSLSKPIPENSPLAKGEKLECVKADGLYKYYIGRYASRFEAAADLAKVRSRFKGAFIVHLQ